MGVRFIDIETYVRSDSSPPIVNLVDLALKSCEPLIHRNRDKKFSHIICATSGPDKLAPSFSQELRRSLGLREGQGLDLIQGCAGGCSALLLGSRLAASAKSSVLVVAADLPLRAINPNHQIYKSFADGAFSTIISFDENSERRLIREMSIQYTEFTDIVSIPIGHQLRNVLKYLSGTEFTELQIVDSLGFHVDNRLITKMARKAVEFSKAFGANELRPDFTILHQPNLKISAYMKDLKEFSKLNLVDLPHLKNSGAATVGIGFASIFDRIDQKRVIISSFGTGGVVTCGCWQC